MQTTLKKSKKYNPNYLAKVIKLGKPIQHPNAERLLGWIIDGNKVWTDNINYKENDVVVYFPLECQINPLILSQLNLYSNSDLNHDKTQKGFFDKNGRVRAIRLRGEPSEGFILKTKTLEEGLFGNYIGEHPINFPEHLEFDTIEDTWICRKYVPTKTQGKSKSEKSPNKLKDILIKDQFRFHYDTEQMKKNLDRINPDTVITISNKIHGTSGVSANVLVKKKEHPIIKYIKDIWTVEYCFLSLWVILMMLFSIISTSTQFTIWFLYFPHLVLLILNKKYRFLMSQVIGYSSETEYNDICSSRKVIKSIGEETKNSGGYYKFDIWKHCHEILKPTLENGVTLYYEIVGYLPDGRMIQKGYDYHCINPVSYISEKFWIDKSLPYTEEEKFSMHYRNEVNFKVRVYRITYTTPDGKVIEFSWEQIKNYCQQYGLTPVDEIFTGNARVFLPIQVGEDIDTWRQAFMDKIQQNYFHKEDPQCNHKVPSEGVVIRIENGLPKAYKFKSFSFLELETKQLDSEENNIEDGTDE